MSRDENSLTLRIATAENAAELARLIGEIEGEPVAQGEVIQRLEALHSAEIALLASAGGQAVGLACLRLLPGLTSGLLTAELTELYIQRAYQGEGERALLAMAEGLARQRGASQLTLLTGLKNANAQALYRALGFRDYALAMRKVLAGIQVEG